MVAVSAEARPAENLPPVQVVEDERVRAELEQCDDGLAPWANHVLRLPTRASRRRMAGLAHRSHRRSRADAAVGSLVGELNRIVSVPNWSSMAVTCGIAGR